jgi:hypothetical protein
MPGESKGMEAASRDVEWAAGVAGGGGKWRWRDWAQVKPEEGDDRWGPPISPARRGAKAARGRGAFL